MPLAWVVTCSAKPGGMSEPITLIVASMTPISTVPEDLAARVRRKAWGCVAFMAAALTLDVRLKLQKTILSASTVDDVTLSAGCRDGPQVPLSHEMKADLGQ
ncbi:protein of unknown function [Nitrospira japonica]|uniref:Uncharacterized protein n=1 Tax=Nitrospira japonica TaxID=1325564 RepID=A0A1W1I842_9BACT|nr:protein of unknown function [Nitrospira japonica]